MKKKIRFGFSSCPNDTFIFYALANRKINTFDFDFDFIIADVEELNRMALQGDIDVTKISFNAYGKVAGSYILSNFGSALGENNGPLIISNNYESVKELEGKKIAVPGINTTANLLMTIAFPQLENKKEYLFSDIEYAILNGEVDAGLIIHETRFTYHQKGLKKVVDLGQWWEGNFNLPLPLGGICISRKLSADDIRLIDRIIGDSVDYAIKHPEETKPYIKKFAQETDDTVIENHISLYVNEYTHNIGELGKRSVKFLLERGAVAGFFKKPDLNIFVE
jgi:1,4-dihydroxy-6-naphthoate synthase